MKKYNIIHVNNNYEVEILETFIYHKDAIEYLTALVDRQYKNQENEKSYKVYYETKDHITVNYVGYFSKSLDGKFYIIPFQDNTDINDAEDED